MQKSAQKCGGYNVVLLCEARSRAMATMFPRQFKGNDKASSAERKLFELFAKHLDAQFTIFHSQAFQEFTNKGTIADRECDFVIAHPQYGIFVLEVKGGRIEIDGATGDWYSVDRNDQKHPIKNPAAQAKTAAYGLRNFLNDNAKTRHYNFGAWYAVALPDIQHNTSLGSQISREILLDKDDLQPSNLQKAILNIFKHYGKVSTPPGVVGIDVLTKVLAPSFYLRSTLARDFEDEIAQIKELTEEQYDLLNDLLGNHNRYVITGCAGSGKTMIAITKAIRLAQSGQSVLYTCYNANLAKHLQDTTPEYGSLKGKLRIAHFHQLCREIAEEAGDPIKPYDQPMKNAGTRSQDYYDAIVPKRLDDAINKAAIRFDTILVDEGQDFHDTYWKPLMRLLRDRERSAFYIFCDDNQRISSDDALPFTEPRFHIKKNCRNTKPIGVTVGKYHRGMGSYIASGPESERDVRVVDMAKFASPEDALEAVFDELAQQKIPPSHIILLTPRQKRTQSTHGITIRDCNLVPGINPTN